MSTTLSGKDYISTGGSAQLDEAGTYECTLVGAQAYMNEKYQETELLKQATLIWDTGYVSENDDGEEVPVYIYDSYININLNEKAKLTGRLTALAGGNLDISKAEVGLPGIDFNNLPHWRDAKSNLDNLILNGEELFGRKALVTITMNAKGYPKVENVTAPVRAQPTGAKGKMKPKTQAADPTQAPEGAPT